MDAFLGNNDFVKMELKTLCTVLYSRMSFYVHYTWSMDLLNLVCIQVDEGKVIQFLPWRDT